MIFVLALAGCSPKEQGIRSVPKRKQFVSEAYHHFEGGLLFRNVAEGLDVLWEASFRYGHVFKENVGFFVRDGLIIAPNRNNTRTLAKLSAFPLLLNSGKLFILVQDRKWEVLAIIHTHPDAFSLPMPSPRFDYQFGYLGLHNYVMARSDLFDAYKDRKGNEWYDRLGARADYGKIPLLRSKELEKQAATSMWVVTEK
jgi:hypothetical protein